MDYQAPAGGAGGRGCYNCMSSSVSVTRSCDFFPCQSPRRILGTNVMSTNLTRNPNPALDHVTCLPTPLLHVHALASFAPVSPSWGIVIFICRRRAMQFADSTRRRCLPPCCRLP
ncbi:hypothetical protein P280DRAFT_327000 [Massarina eburnea CBS 473.64]|uniref:Uncharacterized protein n=1 Tax=Massarina eburnea CBS 473.64 TaxID=1395130 RepID=A0A6A6S0R5_9PLEO|nr:hypothetical protein P280DRAFT_327000 [Massarina eburnea CBS 473.64]